MTATLDAVTRKRPDRSRVRKRIWRRSWWPGTGSRACR